MADTAEVWTPEGVRAIMAECDSKSAVARALAAFAAQLDKRADEAAPVRDAVAALRENSASACGVKPTPGALKAARNILAGHRSPELLTAVFGAIIARDTRVGELLQALKDMRAKYGMYACEVCDRADAEIARAELGK